MTISANTPATAGALQGLRVLDLSRVLAGPYAAQMLGDLGADVIKVERPGLGDEARGYGPPLRDPSGAAAGQGAMFLSANRNKRSMAVDLAHPAGQQLVRQLAGHCDVLIENFKVGSLAPYGLDAASLCALYPRLVYCSITGYGQTGPYAERPGYDALFQAQSGMMSLTGLPDHESGASPLRVGFAVADVLTSHQAVIAVQAALLERQRSGLGQHIDMALLDGAVAALSHAAQGFLINDELPPRMGNGAVGGSPSDVLPCQDGNVYLTAPSNALFARLCQAIGQPELTQDPRFASGPLRGQSREALLDILQAYTRPRQRVDVVATFTQAGVPAGLVNDLRQALADPQAVHRGLVVPSPHPLNAGLTLLASPLRLTRTPPRHDVPPPLLGQHTDAILRELLQLSDEALSALRRDGVVA